MGSALAATAGDRRDDRRPIRRRCCVGISAPRRRRAVPPRLEGTARPVRSRAAPGQDATDRVRALRSRKPNRAWRREAGDVQLPRIHPHLWANVEDRQVPRSTQDHPQAALRQIESAEGGASETQTSVHGGAREMVEVRCTGILQLSCSPWESGQSSKFSVTGDPALATRATTTQPERSDDLATIVAIAERWLPKPRILHPYPTDRGDGGNVGIIRSPLRVTVLPDCGGGRQVNRRPYRD